MHILSQTLCTRSRTTGFDLDQKPPASLSCIHTTPFLVLTSLQSRHGGWSQHNNKAQAVLHEQEHEKEDEERQRGRER